MFLSARTLKLLALSAPFWLLWPLLPFGWVPMCVFLLMLGFLTVRDALGLPNLHDFICVRTLPARFSFDIQQQIELSLTNKSDMELKLTLRDTLPPLLEQLDHLPPLLLEAGQTARLIYGVLPVTRGHDVFGDVYVRVSSRLGLVQRQIKLTCTGDVRVYPRFVGVDKYELVARIDEREEALRKARTIRGRGSEFESLRPYLPGEDLRYVDWKISAKRGSLISRNYQVEKGQTLAVLIDAGRFMNERIDQYSRFEYALNATTMLAHVAQRRGDAMAVATFSNRIESFMPPMKGPKLMAGVLESVYKVQPRKVESDYWNVMAQATSRLKKRSLIIMLTDVLDPAGSSGLFNNLIRATRKHLVLCVVFVDPRIYQIADSTPETDHEIWLKAAASDLAVQRRLALEKMKARGILVLETSPQSFSPELVRKYLEIRKADLQ